MPPAAPPRARLPPKSDGTVGHALWSFAIPAHRAAFLSAARRPVRPAGPFCRSWNTAIRVYPSRREFARRATAVVRVVAGQLHQYSCRPISRTKRGGRPGSYILRHGVYHAGPGRLAGNHRGGQCRGRGHPDAPFAISLDEEPLVARWGDRNRNCRRDLLFYGDSRARGWNHSPDIYAADRRGYRRDTYFNFFTAKRGSARLCRGKPGDADRGRLGQPAENTGPRGAGRIDRRRRNLRRNFHHRNHGCAVGQSHRWVASKPVKGEM